MRILVVDDEKLLVKGVKFNLENEGYEVECAYDGASAVELARNGRFDLIILDVMMPELDGQEACMRIREFSNVPIIMLTAKSEDADKLMGFECGADDYVTKPFNILELKARVRALLRRAAGTQRNRGAVLTAGDLSLNTEERVAIRDGKTSSEMIVKQSYADKLSSLNLFEEEVQAHEEFAVLDKAGRVQIPREMLEQFGVAGNKVKMEYANGKIVIEAPRQPAAQEQPPAE